MAKKHRVKRQKYVEHLLALEKNRESYLEKRRVPKRSREMRNNEEATGEGRELMESKALKKRRMESAAEDQNGSDEEEHHAPPRASSSTTETKTAGAKRTDEKSAFFAVPPFSEQVKASTGAEKCEPEAAAKATAAKKSLKRRHY
ncbi:hypothetical protein ABL78_3507 [Leptomonas seymouri]|uniref:Uncharacterized protein n=1 Tax=Leptomonas seymouri TaxID=5684 RepID=A0A0N1HXV1_LEPSE|nr:hypothetical protein ABL78_3507 [Leptomonas seymouri]|eukprot:KPI87423.1 hypothetical protein ABL78_3507 [Leptomonas seymouri]